ncbi:hypothetical protein LTR78_007145 [Recurvomyces mirabilis]|uniref:F-box domain-containing protein n=1 Tax=Recurvomyces mirabilis TaxID=574656 RepID=A0AAE0WJU4_9PEZI|nr:hypothetical protein LTR78_007145 [Recurvomyces mirabilis]KAK5150883.1 hypothetical protein LTS14_009686 [Recurvomyces mirabilis]
MSARSLLTALPEELIVTISACIYVGDLLNFALTCKTTHRCAKEHLAVNATYAREWIVRHDRLPLTAPDLLRLATKHVDQIWHLRSLDFWTARARWDDWKTDEYDDPSGQDDPDWPDPAQDCTDLDTSYFTEAEMNILKALLRDQLRLRDEEADLWTSRILDGNDEPLKCLLMANAPRLDRVNFIAIDMARSDDELAEHPLTVLTLACSRIKAAPHPAWPLGLQNLRQVSICTGSDLRHPHDAYYMQPRDVAPLFALPNIRVLNLQLLGYMDEEAFDLESCSSTVEDLAFTCCEISMQAFEKFVRAAKRLRRLGNDDLAYSAREVIDLVAESHAGSIEELVVRPRPTFHDFVRHQGKFTKLKLLDSLDISDSGPRQDTTSNIAGGPTKFATYLPRTLEKLQLYGNRVSGVMPSTLCADLLRAVAELAEDERFACLTKVCMYDTLPGPEGEHDLDLSDWDDAAYQRICKRRIDIHHVRGSGNFMTYEEHAQLHHDFSTGTLLPIESHPGPASS